MNEQSNTKNKSGSSKTSGSGKNSEGQSASSHDAKIMTLFEHLDELRARLVRSIAACLVLFCVAMYFWDSIFAFLKIPVHQASPHAKLHFTDPMDPFMTSIKVGFFTSLVGSCPIWLYQFWRFLEPALYPSERKYVLPFTIASVVLFFVGITVSFTLVFPMAMKFLLEYGSQVGEPIITVSTYMANLSVMVFGFGVVFEAPLLIVLLGIMDLIEIETLAKHRGEVAVGVSIVAAILTPPDPISQIGMGVPLYIMFELSIIVLRLIKRNTKVSNESTSVSRP